MPDSPESRVRRIPSIDILLQDAELAAATAGLPRRLVVESVRQAAGEVRAKLLKDATGELSDEALRAMIRDRAVRSARAVMTPYFRKVINATGIILHTGLGRAVLPRAALGQIAEELNGYSLLQMGAETGKRSSRDERIELLLRELTGCEAATVVNNNAAATMLVLNTVDAGREVIVSRGQLVEIGGAFRLPEVMAASGARMVEVGTTNKTHLRDYERAITENTAAILRVNPSNYKIMGFTSEVALADLVELAHARKITLIDDVGAGAFIDFSRFGFQDQATLGDSIRTGADLTTSSADKLIGSSQGGIILGRQAWIEKVRENPLARILRVGKLTLAALEATLKLFLDEATALREVPTLAMLARSRDELHAQAHRIAEALVGAGVAAEVEVIDGSSQMGSGSLPTQDIPTCLGADTATAMSADDFALRLRTQETPVFARIQHDQLLFDPRTLQDGEEPLLVAGLRAALAAGRED
jgi:L-seryl-tRNA(Ser) seleniumtransferase